MEEIVTNTEYLGRLMVCCVAYEGLYLVPTSKPCNYSSLKLAVEELYREILEFLVETAKYLNRKTLGIQDTSFSMKYIAHSLTLPQVVYSRQFLTPKA